MFKGKILSFFVIALTLKAAHAQSIHSIEGVWEQVQEGCDLTLSDEQLEQLYNNTEKGIHSFSVLSLDNGTYNARTSKGISCDSNNPAVQQTVPGTNMRAYCGGTLESEGEFKKMENQDMYSFNGKIIKKYEGWLEGTGVLIKIMGIELKKNVLIVRAKNRSTCGETKDHVSYYIPHTPS